MQLEAPGTFHHSLVVASLAEAAAEKIGANAPMCRVCSYFHDVGKLKKPGYFIENQHDGVENPHDALTPTMSALIIIAHVKDGVDLAVKHKLNPRIIDVIQEHHGDSLVAFSTAAPRSRRNSNSKRSTAGWKTPRTCRRRREEFPLPRPPAAHPRERHHRPGGHGRKRVTFPATNRPLPGSAHWSRIWSARKSTTASSMIVR
jgi:cyclic-di-AMP phosphodiesterase PgpH